MLIENITSKSVVPVKNAALYYKTEPFFTDISKYTHTNNWEIVRSIEVLTSLGYSVDLIDRGNDSWVPKKEYDLFLGLGVGNSGKNFARYARLSKAKVKILLSMGPQPDISNDLVIKRYKDFNERNNQNTPTMRTVQDVIGDKFQEIIAETDYIFNIGEKNNKSYKSYLSYEKPILHFYPAVSPSVSYRPDWSKTRDLNTYLCFAGNGLICKGVDILVEAFLKDKNKKLHICGPAEAGFFEAYKDKIAESGNIFYHGFIEPGGEKFNELAGICSFAIFHSAAEGCCTSVATAMRAGLVPVINEWTGINTDTCGFNIVDNDNNIKNVQDTLRHLENLDKNEYYHHVEKTLEKSKIFTQDEYTKSYSAAILEATKTLL
jgi:hypothetical protein